MNLINQENIQILPSVDNWMEAIKIAAAPLIEREFIEERYVQAIFDSTEKFGPYYVLAPEIAMPHAGPNDGVLKEQISLLVLKEPIKFSPEGYDVRLVFILASPDAKSHLDKLRVLLEVFGDEQLIQKIIGANTSEEIVTLLKKA